MVTILIVFEKLIRTENYLLSTARGICQLNGKNNQAFTTND